MTKDYLRIAFLLYCIFSLSLNPVLAATKTSTASGNWSDGTTWVGGLVPNAGDDVIIKNGHTVTLTANSIIPLTLTIESSAVLDNGAFNLQLGASSYTNNGTHNASGGGNIYINGGYALFDGSGITNCDIDQAVGAFSTYETCNLTINGNIYNTGNDNQSINNGTLTIVGDISLTMSNDQFMNEPTGIINHTGNVYITNGGSFIRNTGIFNTSGNINIGDILGDAYFWNAYGGTTTIGGDLLGYAVDISYFFQEVDAIARFGGRVFPNGNDGNLCAAGPGVDGLNAQPNTIEYFGSNQVIKIPRQWGAYNYINGTYSKLILSGTGTKTMESNLAINDSLIIRNTAVLDVSATPYNIDLKGHWTNTSTASLAEQTGTITLSGIAAQNITASAVAGGETFYNLTINNTGTGVTLNNPATVSNALTLTDGTVFTDATNLLILNDNATSTAGSAASFVDGPMKKTGNDAFVFPSGDGAVWARIGISAPSTVTTAYTAQYFNAVYGDGNLAGDLYTTSPHHVSSLEYWTLAQGINNDDIQITLFWENASISNITDCPELSIGHFTGSAWEEEAATTDPGSTCSGIGSGSITTNAIVGTYSPFTFASKYGWANNPLPIELLSFTGELNAEGKVLLNWTTSTETNNHYFTVERISSPPFGTGKQMTLEGKTTNITSIPVGTLPGAGNSGMPLSYQLLDKSPRSSPATDGMESGMRYYRLKQTDYDGKSTYSQIISVAPRYPGSTVIYPNPATDNAILYLSAETEELLLLTIVDKLGRIVIKQEEKLSEGPNYFTLDVAALNQGAYIMQLEIASGTIEQKRLMIVK